VPATGKCALRTTDSEAERGDILDVASGL
jgi:hypothetical protein